MDNELGDLVEYPRAVVDVAINHQIDLKIVKVVRVAFELGMPGLSISDRIEEPGGITMILATVTDHLGTTRYWLIDKDLNFWPVNKIFGGDNMPTVGGERYLVINKLAVIDTDEFEEIKEAIEQYMEQ